MRNLKTVPASWQSITLFVLIRKFSCNMKVSEEFERLIIDEELFAKACIIKILFEMLFDEASFNFAEHVLTGGMILTFILSNEPDGIS